MRIKLMALRDQIDLTPVFSRLESNDWSSFAIREDGPLLKGAWTALCAFEDRLVSPEYGRQFFDLTSRPPPVRFLTTHYLMKPAVIEALHDLHRQLDQADVDDPQLRLVHTQT